MAPFLFFFFFFFFFPFSFLPNKMEADSTCDPAIQLAKIGKMVFTLTGQELERVPDQLTSLLFGWFLRDQWHPGGSQARP